MRETTLFFLYLLACLVLAALLTWPLMQTGWVDHDPQRVMGRMAQVFILIGLFPVLKAMGVADRRSLGYATPRPGFLTALGLGWLSGVAILSALALALVALEVRTPEAKPLADLTSKIGRALIGGLLVAIMEETFFRGALYAAVARRAGAVSAIQWSALLYALLHFLKPRSLPEGVAYDWAANWGIFLSTFTSPWQWRNLDSFLALLLVGVFLGLVRRRTGHVGWCIGLHAGWVFVIQVTRSLTDGNDGAALAWLAGSYDGVIGWLAAAWIGVLVLALGLARPPRGGAAQRAPDA
jgi:membrane protease YdiL (CAAX protease family)